jgi:dynactin complex subunit
MVKAKTVTPPTPIDHAKLRDNLLEKYQSLQREKRELRKRNAQAQTNICQYLRKHSIDLFASADPDKSQVCYLVIIDVCTFTMNIKRCSHHIACVWRYDPGSLGRSLDE